MSIGLEEEILTGIFYAVLSAWVIEFQFELQAFV